ncbi:unnamed protein product [Protopolystoma xenopodis]|uniref:Uncharacterized protein n=1 Tax=Protopolystoma xenopodis TaxID=117903 RepID=A0A3S5A6I2_9PLAT|nr:unnamed protein product [Protopolystoma xenopodis]
MDGRFDDQLAFHLIRGRLASALSDDLSDKIGHTSCTNGSELGVAPPARNPGAAVFSLLSSVMLPLANLLEQAEQMGYLTPTCGGSRLRTWLASQTTLEQTHRVNAYLAQLRTCLTDRQRLLTHFEVHGDVRLVPAPKTFLCNPRLSYKQLGRGGWGH